MNPDRDPARITSSLSPQFAPARGAAVYTVEIEGEAVILDESNDRLHLLNPSAALVWAIIDGDATVDELASELAADFAVTPDAALVDVLGIVGRLSDEGLLAVAADSPDDAETNT